MIEHKKSDSRVWIVIIIDKEGNTNYPLLSPNPTDNHQGLWWNLLNTNNKSCKQHNLFIANILNNSKISISNPTSNILIIKTFWMIYTRNCYIQYKGLPLCIIIYNLSINCIFKFICYQINQIISNNIKSLFLQTTPQFFYQLWEIRPAFLHGLPQSLKRVISRPFNDELPREECHLLFFSRDNIMGYVPLTKYDLRIYDKRWQ